VHALLTPITELSTAQAWWVGSLLYLVGGVIVGRRTYWRTKAYQVAHPRDQDTSLGCGTTAALLLWPLFLVIGTIVGIIRLPPRDQRKQ
jgi:hypothetical protein